MNWNSPVTRPLRSVPSRLNVLLNAATVATLLSISPAAPAAELKELRARLAQQLENYPNMETLRASYATAANTPGSRSFHELVVRLDGPISVVSETHDEGGLRIQKDYFLHEAKLYAFRTRQRVLAPDGKTVRIAENRFFFDQGSPIHRGVLTQRIPAKAADPDLAKARETTAPLPPDLDGWADQLGKHAFTIARSFRPHVGQHVFGDWDQLLLKNAPPGEESLTPLPRARDWLPEKNVTALPIDRTESPDGLFQIGWGYRQGPVDWAKLAYRGEDGDWSGVTFSTKLAPGPLDDSLENDTNLLMHGVTGKPISDIGHYHPGERQRFNHDEILVDWSPSSQCFIVRATEKWGDQAAGVGWVKNGKCQKTSDILQPLQAAVGSAIKKGGHPAAKRLRAGEEEYALSIERALLEDNGTFEIAVCGEVPRDDDPSGRYHAIVQGTFAPGAADAPAILKNPRVKVLPAE